MKYQITDNDRFKIKGLDGFITIEIEEAYGFPSNTCYWGGYDTRSIIEIKAGNFIIKGELYIATGDIYRFLQELKDCHKNLEGIATLKSYEGNLEIKLNFKNQGHIEINGYFQEFHHSMNELRFEIESDQSYFNQTLIELNLLFQKYGDMNGVIS